MEFNNLYHGFSKKLSQVICNLIQFFTVLDFPCGVSDNLLKYVYVK